MSQNYLMCLKELLHFLYALKCPSLWQQKMWNVQATKNGTTAFIWINNYWASTRVSNTWKLGRELWVKSRTPQPDKCFVEIQSSFLFVLPSKRTSIQKCTMNTRAAVPHLLLLGWMICPVLKGIEKYSQHCPY